MPAPNYLLTPNAELSAVDKVMLDAMILDDPIFQLFPISSSPDALVMWDQEDSAYGLMQARGYNGLFAPIPKLGKNRYLMKPGVYGERDDLDELTLTLRSQGGLAGGPVDIRDLQAKSHQFLTHRHVNRMRWILWQLLANGIYNVLDPRGVVVEQATYSPQVYNATTAWSNRSSATPFSDMQSIQDLDLGQSVVFDHSATAFMLRATFNNLYGNVNASDFGRFKIKAGSSPLGLKDVNEIMADNDLPQIKIVNDSYIDIVAGVQTPRRFFPTNKVTVVGRRTNNAPLGGFVYTRNVNIGDGASNDSEGQVFVKTIDTGADPNAEPPRRVSMFRGFNGGPKLPYPGAIVNMNV